MDLTQIQKMIANNELDAFAQILSDYPEMVRQPKLNMLETWPIKTKGIGEFLNADTKFHLQLIHWVAFHGYVDAFKMLVALDPSLLEARDHSGLTPCHYAAINGQSDIIKIISDTNQSLLKISADRKKLYLIPAYYAAAMGHHELIKIFLNIDPELVLGGMDRSHPFMPGPVGTYHLCTELLLYHQKLKQGYWEHIYSNRLRPTLPPACAALQDRNISLDDFKKQVPQLIGQYAKAKKLYEEVKQLIIDEKFKELENLLKANPEVLQYPFYYLKCTDSNGITHFYDQINLNLRQGATIAHWAAFHGHARALSIMVQIEPTILDKGDWRGQRPMYYAVRGGQTNMVAQITDLDRTQLHPENAMRQGSVPIEAANHQQHQILRRVYQIDPSLLEKEAMVQKLISQSLSRHNRFLSAKKG